MDASVALNLHSSLLQEVRSSGFDICSNHKNETDTLLSESLQRVQFNEALKKAAGGPSARRLVEMQPFSVDSMILNVKCMHKEKDFQRNIGEIGILNWVYSKV